MEQGILNFLPVNEYNLSLTFHTHNDRARKVLNQKKNHLISLKLNHNYIFKVLVFSKRVLHWLCPY